MDTPNGDGLFRIMLISSDCVLTTFSFIYEYFDLMYFVADIACFRPCFDLMLGSFLFWSCLPSFLFRFASKGDYSTCFRPLQESIRRLRRRHWIWLQWLSQCDKLISVISSNQRTWKKPSGSRSWWRKSACGSNDMRSKQRYRLWAAWKFSTQICLRCCSTADIYWHIYFKFSKFCSLACSRHR